MKRYAFATAAMLLVVFPWRQTPQADGTTYTVEALGNLAAIGNLVPAETGINASGQISGYVKDPSTSLTRAVRYTDGIGWAYVPGLDWGSDARGINGHGDIVGTHQVGSVTYAYRYHADTGAIDDIHPANGSSTSGWAINDNDDVVGQTDFGTAQRAFIAHPGDKIASVLSTLGLADQACGVNKAGQVAVTSSDPNTGLTYAARIDPDGSFHNFGTIDATFGISGACAIDELGHVGGFSSSNTFATFDAVRWDAGDHPVVVDSGLPSTFGNVESISAGVSVGWYQLADFTTRALMYTDANGPVDLNTQIAANSGWVLSQIKGINESGQMVGDGLLNGVPTVFRLNPPKAADTTPPVIAPHADVTAEATGPNGAIVTYTGPATTDNVDAAGTASCSPASGSTFALGSTMVTCHATDAAGNAATPTTFNVIVKDTTPPVIAPHADVAAEATGPNGATVSYSAPATTDAVDGNGTAACAPASGSTFALGATTVTCHASDAAGNAAVPTMFSVVVKDTTAPVIAAHADVTTEATGASGATVAYSAPATTDAVDGTRTATCAPASGSAFALGTTTVTCNATDAAGNVATPTTFKVVVKDTTAPVIAAHADVTAEATGPTGANVTYSAPTTTDAVDGSRTASCAPASGSTFALGTSTVTCNATDAAGNVATPTTFKVVVRDTTAPVIAAHVDVTAEATGPSGANVAYSAPATTDAVDGNGSATCAPASGSTFPLGATTVTCHASDAAGNVAVPTAFKVIVRDTTAPVISLVYASPDAIWPPNGKMVPVGVMVTATDIVDPSPSCVLTSISGGSTSGSSITGPLSANVRSDSGAIYTLTVTCSDFSGNKSSASANVVVQKTNGGGGTPKANGKPTTSTPRLDDDRDDRNGDGKNDRDRGRNPRGE